MARPLSDRALIAAVRRSLPGSATPSRDPPLLLVGVSGGPDSLALLAILCSLRDEGRVRLHAVTVDHGLRGARGAADTWWVRQRCDAWAVPCTAAAVDVPGFLEQHPRVTSVEEAARTLRYRCFAEIAAQVDARAVAVAHTRDDQVESVLLHLVRGAGPTGLGGMRTPWEWFDPATGMAVQVIRPLLEAGRSDTAAFCARHGLEPRVDETNGDLRLSRNRLRHTVLPALREAFPGAEAAVLRMAAISRADADFWSGLVAGSFARVALGPGGWRLDRQALLGEPPAIRARLLQRAYHQMQPGAELEQVHLDALLVATAAGAGRRVSLPGGVVFETSHRLVEFRETAAVASPAPGVGPVLLTIPGVTRWNGWTIAARLTGGPAPEASRDAWSLTVDWSDGGEPLAVRRRATGDRLRLPGMDGAKKLQDLLVDAHVPRAHRDQLPVLTAAKAVVWVAGVRRAAWRADLPDGAEVLELTVTPLSQETAALVADQRRGYL